MNRRNLLGLFASLFGSSMVSCKDDVTVKTAPLPNCVFQDTTTLRLDPNVSSLSDFALSKLKITIKERTTQPLLFADKAWESKGINYSCVLKVDGKWKMWYEAFDKNSVSDFETNLCYAESEDGKNWIKPILQKIKYNNNFNNNIILNDGIHGMSVFYDADAPQESRYKIVFTKYNKEDESWVYGMSSADGINFENLVLLLKANSDTQNSILFDKGKYKMYLRYWDGGKIGMGRRTIAYSESAYFGTACFPKPIEILRYSESYDIDLYNNAISKLTDDLYLMLPSVFDHKTDELVPHLALSENGLNFYLKEDQAFIPLGTGFDSAVIYISPGAIQEEPDEFIFYYSGKSFPHAVELSQLGNTYSGGVGRFVIKVG